MMWAWRSITISTSNHQFDVFVSLSELGHFLCKVFHRLLGGSVLKSQCLDLLLVDIQGLPRILKLFMEQFQKGQMSKKTR